MSSYKWKRWIKRRSFSGCSRLLSFAALQLLDNMLSLQKDGALPQASEKHIYHVLLKLGARPRIIEEGFAATGGSAEDGAIANGTHKDGPFLRHNERTRALERLLHVMDVLAK
jgi:hypothetical protein